MNKTWRICWVCLFWFHGLTFSTEVIPTSGVYLISKANVTFFYVDKSGVYKNVTGQGRYGLKSKLGIEEGQAVHVESDSNFGNIKNHACAPITNVPSSSGPWIALIKRGVCKFEDKIHLSASVHGAVAVIIYNNLDEPLLSMDHKDFGLTSVFISQSFGEQAAKVIDSGVHVTVQISLDSNITIHLNSSQNALGLPYKAVQNKMLLISVTLAIIVVSGLVVFVIIAIRRTNHARRNRARMVYGVHTNGHGHLTLLSTTDYTMTTDIPVNGN